MLFSEYIIQDDVLKLILSVSNLYSKEHNTNMEGTANNTIGQEDILHHVLVLGKYERNGHKLTHGCVVW